MGRLHGNLYPEVDLILPLAARTAEVLTGIERINPGYGGALLILNATIVPAGGLALFLEAKVTGAATETWAVVYQSGNITTVSVNRYLFKPGASGGSGITVVPIPIPAIYRFRVGVLDTTSITYSEEAHMLP